MKRLWALLLALVLSGGLFAEEAPAGSLDFMYLNLDKFVFGRPTIAGQLSMAGAEAVIRLNLEHANYCVAVAINTDNFRKEKISVIRNMLTSWLLNLGAREVYFRSTVTGDPIGAPVKVHPKDSAASAPKPAPAVKTLTKQAAAQPAAPAKAQPQKAVPSIKENKIEKLPPLKDQHVPAAPAKGQAAPAVKTNLPEAPAVAPIAPRPAEKAAPAKPAPVAKPAAAPAIKPAVPAPAAKTEPQTINLPAIAAPAASPAPAAAKAPAPKPVAAPAPVQAPVKKPAAAPAKIDPVAPLLPPVDLPEAPIEPLKTTPPAK